MTSSCLRSRDRVERWAGFQILEIWIKVTFIIIIDMNFYLSLVFTFTGNAETFTMFSQRLLLCMCCNTQEWYFSLKYIFRTLNIKQKVNTGM